MFVVKIKDKTRGLVIIPPPLPEGIVGFWFCHNKICQTIPKAL